MIGVLVALGIVAALGVGSVAWRHRPEGKRVRPRDEGDGGWAILSDGGADGGCDGGGDGGGCA